MFYTLPFYHLAFTYLYEDNKILLSIILELSKYQFEPKVSPMKLIPLPSIKRTRNFIIAGMLIQDSLSGYIRLWVTSVHVFLKLMLWLKLKSLKIHVVLLTWNLSEQSSTARLLREEACTHIEMNDVVAQDKDLLSRLCSNVWQEC
jgi:hypothetical protein